jgi:2-polyprenyl-6-hydroxyphenyl methylase/3-demethylubiquinone-9 3-methyltransferase
MTVKNKICLWYDHDAEEAASFYAATFPDTRITAIHRAPGDYPGGKQGDVLVVEFVCMGIPVIGLNGGPEFRHSEAFSLQVVTEDQEETDRYWNAIVCNGAQESQCSWCKDRWGVSWQITPSLAARMADGSRSGRGQARVRRDDGDEEDRRRRDRSSSKRSRMTPRAESLSTRQRMRSLSRAWRDAGDLLARLSAVRSRLSRARTGPTGLREILLRINGRLV